MADLPKPRIRPNRQWTGWWDCEGLGVRSVNKTPASAYEAWRKHFVAAEPSESKRQWWEFWK